MTLESWRWQDPAKVYERQQQLEIRRDERMGQKLKEVPEYMQRDMHRWADWARRPQYWTDLRITPFCKIVGISSGGREPVVGLDPQSMAIHKAVMGLEDTHKIVVYAYYVARVWFEDRPAVFTSHGISRATYYRRLTAGTVQAHNRAMRWLDRAKVTS